MIKKKLVKKYILIFKSEIYVRLTKNYPRFQNEIYTKE